MILTFDATAGVCVAGLFRGGVQLGLVSEAMDKGHAERLFPIITELLASSDASFADLTGIVVCTGPGNFTGARIGVAAARGLALSLSIPAVGVDRFEAAAPAKGRACIVLAGRGKSVHAANFSDGVLQDQAKTILNEELDAFADGALLIQAEATDLQALSVIGQARLHNGSAPRPAPRYLAPANAAPSSTPPPNILG